MRTFSDPLRNLDALCARVIGYSECGCGHDECDLWEAPLDLRDDGIPPFPHFSTDPAAARLLEDEIERRGLMQKYTAYLTDEIGVHRSSWDCRDTLLAIPWLVLRATPAQRARAFLKAVEA
jgi:hypothetical protein